MSTPTTPLPSAIAAPQTVPAPDAPLSANGTFPAPGAPEQRGPTWADVLLGGLENLYAAETCPRSDITTPAEWRLTGATGTVFVRNLDPAATPGSKQFPSLFACTFDGTAHFLTISIAAEGLTGGGS